MNRLAPTPEHPDRPAARPFVIPTNTNTGAGAVQHPTSPGGDPTLPPADDWWRLVGGVSLELPLLVGDEFQVVRGIAPGSWVEGMTLTQIVNKALTIAQVVPSGPDLYLQTTEVVSDPTLVLGGFTAGLEVLTPWYRSRDWKALIDGSDGNSNCLANEANAALAALDVTDTINFVIADPPELPLLPVSKQLFAIPVFQPDVIPSCLGVSYGLYSGVPFLAHQRLDASNQGPVTAKPDILAADSVAAPFSSFPKAATNTFSPGAFAGYTACNAGTGGPAVDGAPLQLLSSSINDQLAATAPPDFAADDLPVAGQSVHSFSIPNTGVANDQTYDSTHFCRTPSSYRSGSEPKRYYRIYARGRRLNSGPGSPTFRKGIEITEYATGDGGATWAVVSTHQNFSASSYPDDSTATPNSSKSSRPSIKVFELDAAHFLYAWVDPITSEAFCYESATDDVAAATLMGASAFIAGSGNDSPTLSSSAVHWPDGTASGVTLFFADRADTFGVDCYYYAAGPTWALATIVDLTGMGIPQNLRGADWINAVADSSRDPVRLYVMVGKILYAMQVSFSAGTLTIHEAQAVPIDSINYDLNIEQVSEKALNANAVAWLACPVTQAFAGEPDYSASSDALIVATSNAVYVVSNTAANIVDIADFTGLSVGAALSKLILLRGYFMLTGADQAFVDDPDLYTPVPTVSFYSRLETAARKGVVDLTALTESINSGTWLQLYQSVQVQNSRLKVGPAFSSNTLTNLDGATFTINTPRNAGSSALSLDIPFITTVSFAALLANLYAGEFVVPRAAASIAVRDPYSQGSNTPLLPGVLCRYLWRPPDAINPKLEQEGRILSISYPLTSWLDTLEIG